VGPVKIQVRIGPQHPLVSLEVTEWGPVKIQVRIRHQYSHVSLEDWGPVKIRRVRIGPSHLLCVSLEATEWGPVKRFSVSPCVLQVYALPNYLVPIGVFRFYACPSTNGDEKLLS
jgi:hypothetical protein